MQGIYKIENIENHKVYIGRSKDIEKRWKTHLRNLKDNKHHSSKLQRAYNKLKDKNVLRFSAIEEVADENKLPEREQYWIDYYDAFHKGYNCTEKNDNPKYALKNVKKLEKKKRLGNLYSRIESIYNEEFPIKIHGKTFETRIKEHHYKDEHLLKCVLEALELSNKYLFPILNLGYDVHISWSVLFNSVAICVKEYDKIWLYIPFEELKQMDFKPLKLFPEYSKYFTDDLYPRWYGYESWFPYGSTFIKEKYDWIKDGDLMDIKKK